MGVKAFDRALEIDPNFLREDAHEHDETIYSIAIVESDAIDGNKFNNWLSHLLQTQGQNIFRTKGILNIAGEKERFVFQGVHMLLDGKPDRPWKSVEFKTVFYGKKKGFG